MIKNNFQSYHTKHKVIPTTNANQPSVDTIIFFLSIFSLSSLYYTDKEKGQSVKIGQTGLCRTHLFIGDYYLNPLKER